ncbi:MAG: arginine--tRNA ligase [Candidatus Paceibacterota bacterium]
MEDRIKEIVQKELAKLGAPDVSFAVEWPADLSHGDYAVNAAMAASKALGKNPREIAEALVPAIAEGLGEDASSVEIAGPGFINITLSERAVSARLNDAREESWGRNLDQDAKRVMVEYTDPNPFKEMHIGHLMSNVVGESVARLNEYSGANVMRANFQGDVGPHVAKALWALHEKGITDPESAKEIGDAYTHGSQAYDNSPKAKLEIDIINTAIYEGENAELMELWRKGRDVSLSAFEDLYRILGTKFEYYFFESETAAEGTRIVREHVGTVFTESDGAIIYEGEKKGLHTLVFITSRGTPTYEAKDIGLAFAKEEVWPSDVSIILTAAEQIGHFKVMLAALEDIAPALAHKTIHVPHGFLRLTTGKMSSREGNVIPAATLIHDVVVNTLTRNEDPLVAGQVALGAIKYSILKQSAGSDIVFDFDKSLSLEGDSGPYLQYALVRARSIVEKSELAAGATSEVPANPYVLQRLITRFPEVIRKAQTLRAPHVVAQYLTQLAGEWNSFYANERIIGEPDEAYKLGIANAFIRTMENGLWVLGIPAPERM